MEFFQEPIFTAFVAIVLSFVVAKIVSFAVSNSNSNGVCSVNEGAVAQGVGLNRGLRVKKSKKGQKRVQFVDDVVITRIDRYEDYDNLEFLDEKKSDEFGGLGLNDDSRVEKIDEFEKEGGGFGSEKGKSVIVEEEKIDEFGKEGGRVVSEKGKSVIVEEEKIDEFGKEGGRVVSEKGKSVIVEEEKIDEFGKEGGRVVSEKGKSVIVEEEKIDEFEKEGSRGSSEKGKSVIVEEEKIDEFGKEGGRVVSEKGKSVVIVEEEKIDEFEKEGSRGSSEKGKNVIVEEEKIDEFEKEGSRGSSEKGKSVIVEEEKIDEFEKEGGKVSSEKGKSVIVEKEEIEVMGFGENEGIVAGEDDDWEGIERSELEKVFAEAVNYVEYGGRKDKEDDHLEKLTSDVQMELYGLHKVAVEGPCGGPQPMALKVSARAKWNAWQRLGNMSQEAAMEQYIRALSDSIPAWMHDYSADDDIQTKLETEHERKSELSSSPIGDSKEEDVV